MLELTSLQVFGVPGQSFSADPSLFYSPMQILVGSVADEIAFEGEV